VVLVHRRTFKRFCEVDHSLTACGILDGDALELTIRFAAQPVATRFVEPVGFYEVSPLPASTDVGVNTEIAIHLINVLVEGRSCIMLTAASAAGDMDAEAVPAVQYWQPPNVLKLVPSAPLRANTLYTVMLDLTLDTTGIQAMSGEGCDISCVADGVDTVRPYHFVWTWQTGSAGAAGVADAPHVGNGLAPGVEPPAPVLDIVHGLLTQSLDRYSKRQLLSLQADLGCMLNRVDTAVVHIEQKIDAINRRLQEKARRAAGAPADEADPSSRKKQKPASCE
jgi:hypothetical protein